MIYAGIGSRETPAEILALMTNIARKYSRMGWTLRSGGAVGADTAFELGAGDRKRIYEPWETQRNPHWSTIAERYHPAWDRCGSYAKLLHGRNTPIVLGDDLLMPATCVVCYTDGRGGTMQAVRIANAWNIPVFNLIDKPTLKWYRGWVRE